MSISSVLFVVVCIAMYKLWAYNQRHPGESLVYAKLAWKWLNQGHR